MLKKIIVGILVVTVVGAGGTALAYNAINQDSATSSADISPLASAVDPSQSRNGQQEAMAAANAAGQGTGTMLGAPWQEAGTITALDDFGFHFQLQNGDSVYIELGPPDFWKNQGVDLQVGQGATVVGTDNEGMIHAEQVMLANGETLQVRDENGQPLWSGSESADRGQGVGSADGEHTPDPQAQVDEWVTLEGNLLAFQGGSMTMSTTGGEIITFQTGQPRFFSSQGITFKVGDEIVVVGYYQDSQFMAGDITQKATGLRVLLRDPNGRPLWAGPGNGNGNGNGSQGSGGAGLHQ
jgi:hypothetical protein